MIRFSWILAFSGKIFSTTLLFPVLKVKFPVAEIVKRIFWTEKSFKTIFEDFVLILENENSRVVEKIFPKKVTDTLYKSNQF